MSRIRFDPRPRIRNLLGTVLIVVVAGFLLSLAYGGKFGGSVDSLFLPFPVIQRGCHPLAQLYPEPAGTDNQCVSSVALGGLTWDVFIILVLYGLLSVRRVRAGGPR